MEDADIIDFYLPGMLCSSNQKNKWASRYSEIVYSFYFLIFSVFFYFAFCIVKIQVYVAARQHRNNVQNDEKKSPK